jgi:nitrogen regulatory protein PII
MKDEDSNHSAVEGYPSGDRGDGMIFICYDRSVVRTRLGEIGETLYRKEARGER